MERPSWNSVARPSRASRRTPPPLRRVSLPFLILLIGGGCVDALGPDSSAEGLAGLPIELPTAGSLGAQLGDEVPGAELAERWRNSWTRPSDEGARLRAEIRARVAEALAGRDPAAERRKAEDLLGGLEGLLGPEAEATRALEPALEALRESERASGRAAWEALLAASDHALSIDPEVLAEGLLTCAARAERRKDDAEPYAQQMAIRARHLQVGARRALQGNDPMLAVRRAFYGCRLLAENEVDAEGRE